VRLPELLEGERVLLRRWRVSNAEALGRAVAESAEHLRPWMEWISQEPLDLEQRRAMLERWGEEWAAGGDVVMGVFTQDGVVAERVVGGCGLHRRIGPGGLEIGYWIHPAFTRQGLATEAAALLTEGAFSVPEVDHVEIHHDQANRASGGIPRRLGFSFQGEARPGTVAPEGVGIDWVWRMDRADWRGWP
jgi:RimJ/RimL family protein N-acetyltransferase